MGADCGGMCEYMTDKIISDPDTITTSGYAGRDQGIEGIHDFTLHPDISTS